MLSSLSSSSSVYWFGAFGAMSNGERLRTKMGE
jgi:hypothetical protein